MTELKSRVWHKWHYCCCCKGAVSLCCQRLFRYELVKTTRKFLVGSHLIKFYILLGRSALRVLEVIEGRFRDTCCFVWNCSLMGECH